MPHIVVDDDQARIISESVEDVEIRDQNGRRLGSISRAEIAQAERRADSDGPWYTTQQVLEHLRSLDAK